DALCRAPQVYSALYGCPPPGSKKGAEDETDLKDTSSRELSCNIVLPNTPRMNTYETVNSVPNGVNRATAPGIQIFPLLYDDTRMLRSETDATTPLMVATVPNGPSNLTAHCNEADTFCGFSLDVGLTPTKIDPTTGAINASGLKNALIMNLEDPHAQIANQ